MAKQQMQELATAQKRLEDLRVVCACEAQNVWDFLGQAESALVPFGFSPLRARVLMQEVSIELSLLDSASIKMPELEDVIGTRLEAEGRILAEAVAEHMLMCFRSQDPQVSLEPVVQGPTEEVQEAAQDGVWETVKLVAERFERQPEDA
jgi:hypothetical protein